MNFRTSVDIMIRPVHLIGIKMDLKQTAIFLAEKRISGTLVAANGISFVVIPKKPIVSKNIEARLLKFLRTPAKSVDTSLFFYDRCRIPREEASRGIVCFLSRNPRWRTISPASISQING